MLIQPSFISRELATLRGLDLIAEADRDRLTEPLRRERRARRRAAMRGRLAWFGRRTAGTPSAVVIPTPRAVAQPELAAFRTTSSVEDARR